MKHRNSQQEIKILSKEIKVIKKNQMEILEIKKTRTEIKSSVHMLHSKTEESEEKKSVN